MQYICKFWPLTGLKVNRRLFDGIAYHFLLVVHCDHIAISFLVPFMRYRTL